MTGPKKGKQGRAGQKQKAQKSRSTRSYPEFSDPNFQGFSQTSSGSTRPVKRDIASLRKSTIAFVHAQSSADSSPPKVLAKPAKSLPHHAAVPGSNVKLNYSNAETDNSNVNDTKTEINVKSNLAIDSELDISRNAMAKMNLGDQSAKPAPTDANFNDVLFVIDTIGDSTLAGNASTGAAANSKKRASRTLSASSDEIVFTGRRKTTILSKGTTFNVERKTTATVSTVVASSLQSLGGSEPSNQPSIVPNPITPDHNATITQYAAPTSNLVESDSGSSIKPATIQMPSTWVEYEANRAKAAGGSHDPDVWAPAPEKPYWRDPAYKSQNDPTIIARKHFQASKRAGLRSQNGKRNRKKTNRSHQKSIIAPGSPDFGSEAAYDDYMQNLIDHMDVEEASEANEAHETNEANEANESIETNKTNEVSGANGAEIRRPSAISELISGPSMLVDGKEYGDDDVLPAEPQNMRSTPEYYSVSSDDSEKSRHKLIGLDFYHAPEPEDEFENPCVDSSDEFNSSDYEAELDYTAKEQWEDKEDLRRRRYAAKTDEEIAKLWAKQAELGIESNELIIDDGYEEQTDRIHSRAKGHGYDGTGEYDYHDDYDKANDGHEESRHYGANDAYGDLGAARSGLASFNLPIRGSARRRGGGMTFAAASALADNIDEYGDAGFDIMDFDRPSLRPLKKGRKGRLPPELEQISDPEFRQSLASQWHNDREKKKLKKLEREELRVEGRLSKNGRPDLNQKYPNGMVWQQVAYEISVFLRDEESPTISLPAMESEARKSVHMLASVLGLTSKSAGKGSNRHTTLIRTNRTRGFQKDDFENIVKAWHCNDLDFMGHRGRLAFDRGDWRKGKKNKRSKHQGSQQQQGRGGGLDKTATTPLHGHVVGAEAPPIASSSFGHKLMEKMGWQQGSALGKEGEGRLLPVESVMRTGRAGLG